MATSTKYLDSVLKGDYMAWSVCTQCLYTGTYTLKDDQKTYFTANKTTSSTNLTSICQGGDFYAGGGNLRIEFNVPQSSTLDVCDHSSFITDTQGKSVGVTYAYCAEDAGDRDYNDIYATVAAWRKKG